MIKTLSILIGTFFLAGQALAATTPSPQDYAKYFKVDMDTPLPSLQELQMLYGGQLTYDRRYEYGWNIGEIFDDIFRLTITNYGTSEKRLKDQNEELLVNAIKNLPKEYYQYIGPYLHTEMGVSEKVLNMPGIKETKNKFPTRIAPQLADMEDLEFLSPALYYILMPEAWPKNSEITEFPDKYLSHPKVVYDQKFYEKIKTLVPPEKYMPGYTPINKVTRSDMRTLNPTADSLLTSADVVAFSNTLDEVDAFAKKDNNFVNLMSIGQMYSQYEKDQGLGNMVNETKDIVNPCQRLVLKLKIAGPAKVDEFTKIVGKQGFNLKEWAYTCDKTVKAYRLAGISRDTLREIKAYEKGIYNDFAKNFGLQNMATQFTTMQSVVEMYKAPLSDVLEAKKNRKMLREKFLKMNHLMVVNPIDSLD